MFNLELWEDVSPMEAAWKFDNRSLAEWFFMPYPRTFADWEDAGRLGMFVPRFWESIFVMILCAILITFARHIFDRLIAIPLGRYYNVPDFRPPLPDENAELEAIYRRARGRAKDKHVEEGVKATGKKTQYVQRWFKLRRAVNQPTTLDKLCEALWRFVFYTASTIYGFVILQNKSWYWDTNQCWLGMPFQEITMDVRIYYYVEIGFYLSLLYSLSTDTRRKDFTEMVIHHIVTILLMGLSWLGGYYRIGTLILLVHDVSDIFLESAKTAGYFGLRVLTDALFVIFAVVFAVSRLYYYPFWALDSVAIKARNIFGSLPVWWVYMILLCTLQVLHIFWFSIIASMAIKAIRAGKVEKDDRSDDELDTGSEVTSNDSEAKKDE